jgi:hypothetical protein
MRRKKLVDSKKAKIEEELTETFKKCSKEIAELYEEESKSQLGRPMPAKGVTTTSF